MALTKTKQAQLRQRRMFVERIEGYFQRDDLDEPSVIDETLASSLRTSLSVTKESEQTFCSLLRMRNGLTRTYEVEYLCDSIEAALSAFYEVRAMAVVLRGAKLPGPHTDETSLKSLLASHTSLLRKLSSPKLGFVERMCTLVSLNKIQLMFFARMW